MPVASDFADLSRAGRPQVVHAIAVSAAIVDALQELKLAYPKMPAASSKELHAARVELEHEGRKR